MDVITSIVTSFLGNVVSDIAHAVGERVRDRPTPRGPLDPVAEVAAELQAELQQESNQTGVQLLWKRLTTTAQEHPLTLDLLVEHCFDIDRICAALESQRAGDDDPRYARLADLYHKALALLVRKTVDQVPPDLRSALLFERSYRAYIAESTSRIRLLGIRTPEVVDFDLETAWVDLGVAALRQTAAPGELLDEMPEVATLEAMRERLAEKRELAKVGERVEEDLLPFLFPVRSLDFNALPKPEQFVDCLAPYHKAAYPAGFVTDRLSNGRAFVLVDGLDECEKANHEKVMAWIRGLTDSFGDCRFIVTSRPAGYQAGELRGCRYAEAELQPLGDEQRKRFVERWYRAAEDVPRQPASAKQADKGAADLLDRINQTSSVQIMAGNPLLLSVLCVVHRYRGQRLPQRRADLLNECTEVLLHEWRAAQPDLPPGLVGELDARGKAALVRPLAWWMMEERIAEVRRQDVERIFGDVLPDIEQDPARARELLDQIRDCSGVLVEQRPGILAFAHLVFQEYLAAEHAEDRGRWDSLLEHAEDEQWREVIPLAAGLSRNAAETLVRALRDKGHLNLAGRCVATAAELDPTLRAEVTAALIERAGEDNEAATVLVEIGGESVVRACVQAITQVAFDSARLTLGCALTLPAAYEAAYCEVAALSAAKRADALSGVLTRIGLGDLQTEVRAALEACERPEQKLLLWNPIAEELEASEFGWAMDQLAELRGDVYPLLRLCVLHRLRHRWEGQLSEEQQGTLQGSIAKAEEDLKTHFVRFNEMVEEEIERRLEDGGDREP